MTTLSSLHQSNLEDIKNNCTKIPDLEKEIEQISQRKQYLQDIGLKDLTFEQLNELNEIQEQIKNLNQQITDYSNGVHKFFITNGTLLNEYYEHDQQSNRTAGLEKRNKINIKNITQKKKFKVLSEYMNQDRKTKADFLKEYLHQNKPDYIYLQESNVTEDNYCEECQAFRVLRSSEAKMVCECCGSEVNIILEIEKPSLKDPPMEIRYYEYRRINHFCDWLSNLQGKESTEVPEEIINLILLEIKKERKIENLADLDEDDIRRYLKKNAFKVNNSKYEMFYEHATQILFRITGIPPLTMTPEQEENLKIMFILIQEPYDRFVIGRKNFFSYSCILYKFCQLLGYTEFIKKLKLLKSKDKLYQQDITWKKICRYMGDGWVFHKFF